MALPVRKSYKGAPVSTTLSALLGAGSTSCTVGSVTGWPTTFPFYVVIEPGTSREEKVRVTGITGTTLTIVRAQDDTTAVEHPSASTVYVVFTAVEADEANQIASAMTTKGDLVTTDGSTINRLAVGGTNTHVLQVDSAQTNGIKWGQVATAGIADSAVTLAKLAAAVQAALAPVGTIVAYGGASAPTGWLLCDGSTFNATTYSSLNTVLGGNTLPDLRARVPMGKAASGTGSTLLGAGGARKIASSNLPTHAHALDHDHAAFNYTHDHAAFNTGSDGSHSHAISDPGHSHTYLRPTESTYNVVNAADSSLAFIDSYTFGSVDSNSTGVSVSTNNSTHVHSIDVPSHTGSIDVPAFTGTVTTSFANDDYFQPFVAVNYIIKHDY